MTKTSFFVEKNMKQTADYFIKLEDTYGAHNYHPLSVVLSRGKGVWVWDVEGKRYMDFLSGYSAVSHGHAHKKIALAIKKQINLLTLTGRAFRNDQLGLFCKELCEFSGFEMFLPMNSGAEAVETALKIARKWGYTKKGVEKNKAEIIAFANNFHGRTITIVGMSTEEQYKEGFGAFPQGFVVVEYNNIEAVKKAITKNTVALLIEPIQGEGGIIIPSEGYLTELRRICRENNILLMLDEIQTGFGRTGTLFAFQQEKDAKPDMLIVGKALGGGFYPVSGVLTSKEIMNVIKPGDHGSTFGGNPLACAIGRVSLAVMKEEEMVKNSKEMGDYLLKRLRSLNSKWIKEVRGKGLFIGVELIPESGGARRFCEELAKNGILSKETHDMVIRFAPPLIIKKSEIDFAFKKIKKVLEMSQ